MSSPRCICLAQPYRRYQGESPKRFPELLVDVHDDQFPDTWRVHCQHCGTR